MKTTDDFITGVASTSYITGKPYLVKFADGHTQPTGDWLQAHLAEMQEEQKVKAESLARRIALAGFALVLACGCATHDWSVTDT